MWKFVSKNLYGFIYVLASSKSVLRSLFREEKIEKET